MKCNSCGVELPDEAKFCYSCGEKIEKEALCPKCGAKLQKGAKFCMECGEKTAAGEKSENYNHTGFADARKRVTEKVKDEVKITLKKTSGNRPMISLDVLSPYANHAEYYREGYWKNQEVFANNGFVCCKKYGTIRIFDEQHPQNYIDVKNIPDAYTMLGMNNMGLYFAD